MIQHFLNPPNWFTSASILCSTWALGLVLASPDRPAATLIRACILVMFGGVFDMLDGRVARITNRYSEFGVQLDSFADLISFGVTPAMIVWAWKLHELGPVGMVITFWYILCAAFRLARFNVNTNHSSWRFAGHTQGLTSTMSGACLVIFVWMSNGYLPTQGLIPSAPLVAAVTAFLGLMMISSVPYRSFKDLRRNPRARALFAMGVASCLAGAIFCDPSMWFGVGAFLYIGLGLIDGLITAVHFRRVGHTLDRIGEETADTPEARALAEEEEEDPVEA